MGTNFYAKIKPSEKDKQELISLIQESEDYDGIKEKVSLLYGTVGMYNFYGGVVHLGKRSGGWKFLWNPNMIEVDEGKYDMEQHRWIPKPVIKKYYDLTKESIRNFLSQPNVQIEDEYGDKYTVDEFMDEALNWCKDGYDSNKYIKESDSGTKVFSELERQNFWRKLGYTFTSKYQHDFYSDGLRFSTSIDFC